MWTRRIIPTKALVIVGIVVFFAAFTMAVKWRSRVLGRAAVAIAKESLERRHGWMEYADVRVGAGWLGYTPVQKVVLAPRESPNTWAVVWVSNGRIIDLMITNTEPSPP